MLVAVPVGASPTGGEGPDATVVISGNVKGDRHAGSPDVNVSGAGETRSDPPKEANNSTGRSNYEPGSPEIFAHQKRMVEALRAPSRSLPGEGQCCR